jgi:putative nucleotidyltransferase with HDIG domain
MMVVDQAASLLRRLQIELSATEQQGLMWGVLLHDIGKSFTTQTRIADRRIISPKHEKEGVAPARLMLEQLGVDADIAEVALAIVERHMAPPALHRELLSGSLNTASYERAVERLGRRIEPVRLEPLMVAAMADRLGRATPGSNEEKIAFALPMAEILKVSVADSFKEN